MLAKVAFDGIDQRIFQSTRALASSIFGGAQRFTAEQRRTFTWVSGGRAESRGCARCAVCISLHLRPWAAATRRKHGYGMSVAPDKALAGQNLTTSRGAVEQVPDCVGQTRRQRNPLVLRRAASASSRCYSGRREGPRAARKEPVLRGWQTSLLSSGDSKTGKVNDGEIIAAMSPHHARRATPCSCLPRTENRASCGALRAQLGHPVDAMAAWAPTITLRDEPHKLEGNPPEYLRDPENAAREFGALFVESTSRQFFDGPSLGAAAGTVSIPGEALHGDVVTTRAQILAL